MNRRLCTVFGASVALLIFLPRTSPLCEDASAETGRNHAPELEQIILTFKTHFDIGYTEMATDVIRRYRTTMIDQALEVCDRSRELPPEQQFVWVIPGWPMSRILEDWEGQTAERRRRILEAFRDGRFAVHALPFTLHTELLELEDLVRGLGFASRLSRSVGRELPRDAKMTDVPCHTWVLPTLLRHAGVDFLHLGCNSACRSPEVPPLFWWEGPDGSRLLTMYTAAGYGTGLVPPEDWPHRTWLALVHTGDNHGPPRPDEVKRLLDEARKKRPGVRVRIGRLSDFADAILAEKPDLPVVRGDMPDTWIHGPMSDPHGGAMARTIRPAIAAAESLDTHLRAWGVPVSDPSQAIADAWEHSLLYGEHTWGGALYWIKNQLSYGDEWKRQRSEGKFQRLEDSWAEHTAYIEKARDLTTPLLETRLNTLARAVDVAGRRIVVFNPLPWGRDGVVSLKSSWPAVAALRSIDRRKAVPVESDGDTIRFVAADVPPSGYRTYVPVDTDARSSSIAADAETATMENEFLRVRLDPARGCVRSLVDKRSGRELIDNAAAQGFGQVLYERFDAGHVAAFVDAYLKNRYEWALNELGKPNFPPATGDVPYAAVSPKGFRMHVERSPVSCAAVMDAPAGGGVPFAVATRVVLHVGQPYLDLEITLRDKPADPWPEAGWICLPVAAEQPRFRLDRVGSIVDPARDVVRGANRHLFGVNGGVAVTDPKGHGLGLCALDSPLVSLGKPGCWKYSMDYVPTTPIVYVNLFNNQWTTNFRYWNEGSWTSRVRVWAIDRYAPEADLITPSREARFPLMAAAADGPAGSLPPAASGLALSRKGIIATAFGRDPEGGETLLRLWECAGRSGTCTIHLPDGLEVSSVHPVDLRGRPAGRPITVRKQTFRSNVRAFAPAQFLIKP